MINKYYIHLNCVNCVVHIYIVPQSKQWHINQYIWSRQWNQVTNQNSNNFIVKEGSNQSDSDYSDIFIFFEEKKTPNESILLRTKTVSSLCLL